MEQTLSRAEQKAQTREKLIDCTLHLVLQKHFNQIGIREITREAKLTSNAIYRHFENKQALGIELISIIHKSSINLLHEYKDIKHLPGTTTLVELFATKFVNHFRTNLAHIRLIAQFSTSEEPEYRNRIYAAIQGFTDALELAIDRISGKKLGNQQTVKTFADIMTVYCLDVCKKEAFRDEPDWDLAQVKLNRLVRMLFLESFQDQ